MNADQIGGFLRVILSSAAGLIVGHGFITSDLYTQLSGAAVALVVAIWSWHTNKAGTVIPPKA